MAPQRPCPRNGVHGLQVSRRVRCCGRGACARMCACVRACMRDERMIRESFFLVLFHFFYFFVIVFYQVLPKEIIFNHVDSIHRSTSSIFIQFARACPRSPRISRLSFFSFSDAGAVFIFFVLFLFSCSVELEDPTFVWRRVFITHSGCESRVPLSACAAKSCAVLTAVTLGCVCGQKQLSAVSKSASRID